MNIPISIVSYPVSSYFLSSITTLSDGIRHDRPLAVDVFEDVLYVIGSPDGSVWKTHKFGRAEDVVVQGITVFTNTPRLMVVHPAKRCEYTLVKCCKRTLFLI